MSEPKLHVEWEYLGTDYRLVERASRWEVQFYHRRKGTWSPRIGITDHEADCLQACRDVPHLHGGMLAEAVELLRGIRPTTEYADIASFLSKIDSEVSK